MPAKHTLSESLLSKITLARFLEIPCKAFQMQVAGLESSESFQALRGSIVIKALPGSEWSEADAQTARASCQLTWHPGIEQARLRYQSRYFTRQYSLLEQRERSDLPPDQWQARQRKLWQQLRLINTRNLLTHALIQVVVRAQRNYLLTGEIVNLEQYTQQAAAHDMTRLAETRGIVCEASRISRLAGHLCLLTGEGRNIALSNLFVSSRQRSQYLLDSLIKAEALSLFQGYRGKLLTDDDLAVILNRVHKLNISRRSITHTRRSMAIPDHRERHRHMPYVAATSGFSSLHPLRLELSDYAIPAQAGVYEIRQSGRNTLSILPSHNRILYIGSSMNLKKRLREHLTGNSNNSELHAQLALGNAEVRYKLYEPHRWMERKLYQTFVETFGASPCCNKISP